MVDDRSFPLSQTVYNTFVFGGRSVVSEHIGYYTLIGRVTILCWKTTGDGLIGNTIGRPVLEPAHYYLFSDLTLTHSFAHSLDSSPLLSFYHLYRKLQSLGLYTPGSLPFLLYPSETVTIYLANGHMYLIPISYWLTWLIQTKGASTPGLDLWFAGSQGEYNCMWRCPRPGFNPSGLVNNSSLAAGPQFTEMKIW